MNECKQLEIRKMDTINILSINYPSLYLYTNILIPEIGKLKY